MFNLFGCISILLITFLTQASGEIYCYQCNSNQPGCGTPFNWFWYWSQTCPNPIDHCVKIVEQKGAETFIIRDCLSNLKGFRTDIPADKYEGCRPAAKDPRLAHYVNNSIEQLDIRRDHYNSVTWCFCNFHHRCNSATSATISLLAILFMTASRIFS